MITWLNAQMICPWSWTCHVLCLDRARTGVDDYEGMEVDDDDDSKGPGPQRCKSCLGALQIFSLKNPRL